MSMNTNSFGFFGKVQEVEVKPNEISGQFDGFKSFLWIPVIFTFRMPNSGIEFDVIAIKASLKLKNTGSTVSSITVFTQIHVNVAERKATEQFKFQLERDALELIEMNREGDMHFSIELSFQLLHGARIEIGNFTPRGINGIQIEETFVQPIIPKSIWVEKILEELNYGAFKLIEIPIHYTELLEPYNDIISEFILAEGYYKKQDYDKCIAHCRGALDALHRNLKKIKDKIPSEKNFKWMENIDEATLTYIDELDKANTRIMATTHHPGKSSIFLRNEANSIYLVTLGLVNFVSNIKK